MRIEDVHNIQLKRAQTNHDTYKALYLACCNRIKHQAGMANAPKAMHYQVPPLVWGRPPFKHAHAIRYVTEKLQRSGFKVSALGPHDGLLYVEWGLPPPKKRKGTEAKKTKTAHKLSERLAELRKQLG